MLSQPTSDGNNVILERENVKMTIIPDENLTLSEISSKFDVDVNDGQPPEHHVTEKDQYHIYYKTQKSKSHKFEVKYIIEQ
jgi:hypothetical protein